ncbi:alpha/beta hydrolase fold domain-containing protein [Pseudonocardia acidicola]|uniref:Alpha/beta hydrolase n=1 Tax=Pseudonocardia acidicola TaxID=2724939 RepID=A0ABX1SEY4_9PSEU|nr:alpha/beta hydrolase [Pseudonocardia acidicola]
MTSFLPADVDTRAMQVPELVAVGPLTVFPGVRSHLEIQYAGPVGFRPLTLDLHVPEPVDGRPAPVAVYCHGGGFMIGSRRMGPWRFLLDAGLAVASVGYRFSGEGVFPTGVQDAVAAIRWVRSNAEEFGLDAARIVGFGSSAGAYLVSAAALMHKHPDLVGDLGPTPGVSCELAAVVEHYGPSDFLHMDDDAPTDAVELMDAPGSSIARYLGYVPSEQPERADEAGLLRYAAPDAPPFLIFHGDDDHRVGLGQSRRLHGALTAAGAHAELVVVPGADHASPHFDQPQVHQATMTFLRAVLDLPGVG